jgi:transposase-like protein
MDSPKSLLEAIQYFSDEQVCIDAVGAMRWPDGPRCPDCLGDDAKNPYYLKTQKRWKCRSCRRQFSVKVNTVFEDSPIPLQKWLPALWMLVSCKNGISSWELHRALKVSQKTAWFMLHRLRLGMKNQNAPKLGGFDRGPVEADETFVGPNPMRMHKSRRAKLAAIASEQGEKYRSAGKTIVMGMLDREMRQVRAMVVPNVKRVTLQEKILNNVEGGSQVITDDFPTYRYALADKFAHDVINHAQGYVEGQVHTNGIENFWSLLKRSLRGTYVAVEPFHLDRYVDEQVFRFNNRATKDNPLNDSDRFLLALSQVSNKRLTYKELTGKTGTEAVSTTPEPF